jgi:hypothetical protein
MVPRRQPTSLAIFRTKKRPCWMLRSRGSRATSRRASTSRTTRHKSDSAPSKSLPMPIFHPLLHRSIPCHSLDSPNTQGMLDKKWNRIKAAVREIQGLIFGAAGCESLTSICGVTRTRPLTILPETGSARHASWCGVVFPFGMMRRLACSAWAPGAGCFFFGRRRRMGG